MNKELTLHVLKTLFHLGKICRLEMIHQSNNIPLLNLLNNQNIFYVLIFLLIQNLSTI